MADNEDRKSGGTFDQKEKNAEDNAGATEDAPPRSTREALGKSKSLPALERPSARNNTRISQSESSFIASLKQRSVVPEERTVRRFGEIKLVRTLSQLVGSEHSFVEEEGAEGQEAGEAPGETQAGDTLSYMDFPSTIGTDTKLDAELRHPVRSAETVGEGKTEDALVVTRLQGEATVAPTTMESSVGEPQIAKVLSDLEREKKPVLTSADEVTVYTSFSDSSAPKREADHKLPFPSEGAEEEMAKLTAPGTSRPDVIKSAEEAHRPVPFKTPEETTAGSEVEDTLVERAGLDKQVEELPSKTMTRVETVEPRGDWEGPAGEKTEEETALIKHPPKRRVSTQVSESQASEWRIVERPVPFGSEDQQIRTMDNQVLRATEDHPTMVSPTIAEILMEVELSVEYEMEGLPAVKEPHAMQKSESRELAEPFPTSVVDTAEGPALERQIPEIEAAVTEATTAEVAKREEPLPPTVPEPCEALRAAPGVLQVETVNTKDGALGETALQEIDADKQLSCVKSTLAVQPYPDEAPPIASYDETTPYIEPLAPQTLLTEAQELTQKLSEGKLMLHEAGVEEVSKVEAIPQSDTTLQVRRRSSVLPLAELNVPGSRRKSSDRATVEAAEKEPSYIDTTPSLESYAQEALPIPPYEETTPYIESFPPEALDTKDQELKRKRSEGKVVHREVGGKEEITKVEPPSPSLTTLKTRRRSSIMPPTAAVVPGYRRKSSARGTTEAAAKEPSYIETTPSLESYPQEALSMHSYEETTPYIESFPPEALVTKDQELKRKRSEGKVVHREVGGKEEITKVEPPSPSLTTLKTRRRSSIMPPTAAVVPGYRRKSSARGTVEAAAKEPSYIETTPSLEPYPQEALPIPSYEETTPYLEPFPPEALVTDTSLPGRRRSSVRPLTEWIVPGYRRVSSDREAGEAAKEEPSYIDTTPILEFHTQEAPPIPSYEETTPYIDFSLATDDAELKRKYSEGKVGRHEAGAEEVVSKVEPSPPSFTTLKMRRRSSIMPPTAAVVPGYRRKSSTSRTVEAAAKEPSYIETTPSLESYPQEAPPKPSYEETTPYLEPFPPEALVTDTALPVRRRSSVRPLTEWIVPGYRRVSSDREAGEAAKEEPSYIDTTPILEFYTQEAPPIPSYEETTPYIDFSLATDDAELKRKYSEGKVVPHEAGPEKVVSKVQPSPPSFTTLKMRRRSSIMPPTAAVVPGYRRKSSTSRTVEAAAKEPSYIETTPSLESYPQEAPPKPSYEETTPYLEPFPPEALATDTALQVRRRSSVRPLTEWIVPGYRRVSSDREAGEAAKEEPSYIDTTPILEFYTQEAPPIPSYEETTPYIDFSLATDDAELKRKYSEGKVVPHEAGPEKVVSKVQPSPPSFTTLKMRRRSSIMPPTAAVVPGYRRKSSTSRTVEAAAKEPSYIETTPSLESYPQEAPPKPSYEETTPYLEPFPPEALATDTALQVRRRSSVRPLTEWIVPGYRRVSSDREAGEVTKEEPSYIDTTPILEFYTQEAPPIPSYEETTPYIDFSLATDDAELKRKYSEGKVVPHEAGAEKVVSKVEPSPPSFTTLKMRRRSSIMPPTAAVVPGYRRKSSTSRTVEAAAKEPSYIETTPSLEAYPQEAPPKPSYEETTPYLEPFPHEALATDTALQVRRRSSVRPLTEWIVPGYRRVSSDREAGEAAKEDPSYIDTTPILEFYTQEAPPIPSYEETTPYIDFSLATDDAELKRKYSEGKVVPHEAGAEKVVSKVEPSPPSFTTLKMRRRSSIMPPTAAVVPGYRRKSSTSRTAEAAAKEPSYIETTPSLESYPQEAPPKPSYEETTPYLEPFPPEALATDTSLQVRRRSSVRPLTEWIVPGYRRVSSDREAGEAAKEEPSYIDTTPILEFYTQEAPPIPSYEETTPYIDFSLATDDAELKRKHSERKVVRHEAGAEKVVSKVEPSPPSFTTLKMRRRSSIMPPTAAVVPGYRRKSSARGTVEAAAKEPSYIETTPSLESYPQEAPPIPSYEETTPYLEPFPPEALATDTALQVRRRSSVRPLTEWIVPGYRRVSLDREAGEAAKEEPSYISTTPILEFYTQEAPPIPSYEETTPYIDFSLATDDAQLKRKYSEGKVVPHEAGAEKVVSKVEPSPPSFTTLKMRRRSSIMPPTAAVVPGYRRKSSTSRTVEAAAKEPSYIETTPSLEAYPQEALPIPSYEETTPYLESFHPEALVTEDEESKRKRSEGKMVHREVGAKEITKVEPPLPSLTALKTRRRSSIMPPTAAVVPGYRRKSSARGTVESAAKEPSYIETTPSVESYPQEALPIPSYEATTPYLESFPPEALVTEDQELKRKRSEDKVVLREVGVEEEITKVEPRPPSLTTLKTRRRSSIMPPTAAVVPGYRRKSSARETVGAASKEPSYIETTPSVESYPQQALPIPSYEATTPYLESFPPEALVTEDQELKRKLSEEKVVLREVGVEEEITKVEPPPPSLTTLKKRRRSSIMPPTAAVVPGYRRKSSARETVEAAAKEPSYIETTPSVESYPQEALPIPSYEATTPYLESFPPEALVTEDQELKRKRSEEKVVLREVGVEEEITKVEPPPPSLTTLKTRRRSSIMPPTAAVVPGYRRKSSARETVEAAAKEPSYIETTPSLESYPQEALPIPAYEETTPYIESFPPEALVTEDQVLKRKRSEEKVVLREVGAAEEITKVEPPPPSLTALKTRRRSSIMPPTAAVVPGYRRKSSAREVAESAEKELTYVETTPTLAFYPEEAPSIPSYVDTTPYTDGYPPQEIPTDAVKLQPKPFASMPELREAMPVEEPSKHEAMISAPLSRELQHPSSGTPPSTALVSLYQYKSRVEEIIEGPVAVKAEGAITELIAPQVPTTVDAGAVIDSYVGTTPALESFRQEAPPIPSYEETTPHIESFAPEAIAADDLGLKRKQSERKVIHHEAGAEEKVSKVVALPPSAAAFKMRRRSSVMPPTDSVVPGYHTKSLAREAAEAAAKEPSYTETTPALESHPQKAPPKSSYAETSYIESLPSASSVVEAKALGLPVSVEEGPALDLRKVSSVVQEWALMEIRPPTGTEITEKKETRLAVVDREEVEGRVVPAFQAGESAEGSLVAFPTSAQEKPSTGGIFSHVSMPSSRKRSRQVSDVTGLKHAQRATQQGGEEITVTVPDYEADHEELPSSTGTQSSQEEEELGKGVRKEKVALTLYDEKAPTVVLEAKKHAERLAPEEARIKSVVLKPEVKESQPFVPMPEEASSLVELAQPLVLRPESVMTPAEQPLSAGELLPSTHQVVSGEKAVAEWKPAAVISVTPEPAELSESVARPVAEETSRIPGEVVEVGELEKERPKFAPVPKPPDSVSELPEQGVYATVISPKRDEPLRVFAGIHAITEPKKVPPAGAIERTHDISAPWSTRSSVAAAEEASRGRAAWEKELTRAAGADRRIERLHEKKTAKYSVIIKDGQPVRSISSSSEFTEPVKEDFTDNLAYQYVASEEQVLERIVTLGDTAPTAVTPHPPSDNQPPGAGTKGDASGPHTLPPRPDRSEPKQREEPHSEGPTSEPEFERKEAAPFTNVPDEMVAASVQAVVQEDKQGSSYEIGIPIDEQTEFPTMREDLEKEDQQPEETTADAGFEEFSAAGHAEKVPKAGQSTVESSTALESSEQPLALEYLPAQVDTHVSTTQTPSGMPLLAQLVKMQDETTFEPEKDVPTIQAFEKDYMIPTASQRSDQEEARILTAAPEKIAVETTKLQKLESGPELPQIEHIFSRAAVVEEKPNTDTELTALVVLPQQKVKDEIRHEEAAGQPDITTATVPENDVLRYALIEQNYVEPTCPPQPVIAVEDEIPALEAISERAQPQLVQVPAHAEALAEAALYVHPALTEPQERAAFGEITTIAEVRQSGLEPTKDTPQVDDHAPVQATEGERRELRPTIAESEEFKIYQPAELVLSEVVEKPSQALVPRTAQKQMSEAPSIGAADVEATKQQTAAILFIEAPAGVTASRSEKEAPVKQVSPVAAEEQMRCTYREALTEPTFRPAITGPVEEPKGEVTSDTIPSMERIPGAPAAVTTGALVPRIESALDVHATQGADLTATQSERWSVQALRARPSVQPGGALAGAAQVKEEVTAED
ncbi:uncharacterized protein LOC119431485 [Dermacentor silvarum]|uniref:uncharacterized protein LOC119431485 n=1 Tax=Dermacentor silvarum TaxID=543639 RepID=UPI001896D611|nr:uncharacterized protein LOC119431485 [Dermacentor silvarum]